MLKKDGLYFAYLRKSREDRDAEAYGGEKDTLARHEYVLNDTAKRLGIKIARWYKEVVSGETISDRPEMQQLLRDIETIRPAGVLVVEVERLSRGNPQDQGQVADTFKYANTLIVTPMKIYDLQKENDEEWLDFGLMRSRMEYRTIKRRLINGRNTSAMQGKYLGSKPPYGWQRKKLDHEKGFTLEPCPETSWVLKLMYTMITTGTAETNNIPIGAHAIAATFNRMGIKPMSGDEWISTTVSRIIKNPTNIGMSRIGHKRVKKFMVNGEIRTSRANNNDDYIIVPARWEGQIDEDLYNRACDKLKANATTKTFHTCKSPLAGIIRCGLCGKPMQRRAKGKHNKAETLRCTTYNCPTVCAYYELVEDRLVNELEKWLSGHKLKLGTFNPKDWEAALEMKNRLLDENSINISALKKQLDKIHSHFEQDIYDFDTFVSRSQVVKEQLLEKESFRNDILGSIESIQKKIDNKSDFIPRFENLLKLYKEEHDPLFKNAVMKKLVYDIVYTKTQRGNRRGDNNDAFELDVHVRI